MPSNAHELLKVRAACWIRARETFSGVKLGYEIRLSPQFVADVVGIGLLQGRFSEFYGLIDDSTHIWHMPIYVFEAKASRADFLKTFGAESNRFSPPGSLHWVVVEKGVASPSEVPGFWGLLERRGAGLRELKKPEYIAISDARLNEVAFELLWRGTAAKPQKNPDLMPLWATRRVGDAVDYLQEAVGEFAKPVPDMKIVRQCIQDAIAGLEKI